jgi:hypothetical protein
VVGLDWYPKAMGGDSAGIQGKAQDRPSALDMAVHRQFLRGARGHGLARRRDHGGQPPSRVGMRAGATLASHQALTRDHNPTGNADTARVMRTLNEAGFWRKAWTCPAARIQTLEGGMASDNERYRHSALGDKTPRRVEREHETSHRTPFAAAWHMGSITVWTTLARPMVSLSQLQPDQQAVGQHDRRGIVVEARPEPVLVLIPAHLSFGLLMEWLDRIPAMDIASQFLQSSGGWQVDPVI